jgi:Reverse transcriptase (RNA-dependent DNA polymerase)
LIRSDKKTLDLEPNSNSCSKVTRFFHELELYNSNSNSNSIPKTRFSDEPNQVRKFEWSTLDPISGKIIYSNNATINENEGFDPIQFPHLEYPDVRVSMLLDASANSGEVLGNDTQENNQAGESNVPAPPQTPREALVGKDATPWYEAMRKEYTALCENYTWEVVDRPKDKHVIGSRWVLTHKLTPHQLEPYTQKARFVAKGYTQKYGNDYDETYAPTVSKVTLRTILTLATMWGFIIEQLDAKNAFVHSEIDREIYVEQPLYFIEDKTTPQRQVLHLLKALYGLRQSPRLWFHKLDRSLREIGFKRVVNEQCLYILRNHNGVIIITVHVDDIVLASNSKLLMSETKKKLGQYFKLTDLGKVATITGIQFEEDGKGAKLHQTRYATEICTQIGFQDSRRLYTPMEPSFIIKSRTEIENQASETEYRSLLGSLLYAACCTRPDIMFPVSVLTRFQTDPAVRHMEAAKRVYKYLNGTKELGIAIKPVEGQIPVEMYVDADFAADQDTRRSTTGFVLLVYGSPVHWGSRRQKQISCSTVQAEYIAASSAARIAVWMKKMLEVIMGRELGPAILRVDNNGAISLAQGNSGSDFTKHIDIAYHTIREYVEEGLIEIVRVNSKENLADMFTKPLPGPALRTTIEQLMK